GAELQQLEEALQKQQQDLEEREKQLEAGSEQLTASRAAMQEEAKKVEAHARQWEKDLQERHAKADEEIQARLKESEKKCADMEKAHADKLKQKGRAASPAAPSQSSPDKTREVAIRQQELDKFAKHLQALQQRLREQEEKLRQGIVSQPTPAVAELPEEFKQGQQEILNQVAQQQESFAQVQQVLQKQHEEL